MYTHSFKTLWATALLGAVAGCEQPRARAAAASSIVVDPTAAARLRPVLAAMRERPAAFAPLAEGAASQPVAGDARASTADEERALRERVHRQGAVRLSAAFSLERRSEVAR